MSDEKCVDVPAKNAAQQLFIQKVLHEENYCRIVDWANVQSTGENPYQKSVKANLQLAEGVKQEARQRFLQEKRRQQLRQNNHELRELESQMRAAYVKKCMSAQIFEQEAIKNRTKANSFERKKTLISARLELKEAVKKAEEEDRAKKEAHKQDLLEQMAELNLRRQKAHEHILQDKRDMDVQIERYMKMKAQEAREAEEKRARTKHEMEEFLRSKEEWKLQQTDNSLKEAEKLNELTRQRELQEEQARREKKERQLRKEEWIHQMGTKIHNAAMEKVKTRDTLAELLIDERQAKEEVNARHELQRQLEARNDTWRQMKRDASEKQKRREDQQNADRKLYEEQMRIRAAQEKRDQLAEEKRQNELMEHRKAMLKAFDDKKRLKSKNMLDELGERYEILRAEEKLKDEVEEERIRIVKEHAPGLIDFLPRGALKKSEYKLLSVPPKQN